MEQDLDRLLARIDERAATQGVSERDRQKATVTEFFSSRGVDIEFPPERSAEEKTADLQLRRMMERYDEREGRDRGMGNRLRSLAAGTVDLAAGAVFGAGSLLSDAANEVSGIRDRFATPSPRPEAAPESEVRAVLGAVGGQPRGATAEEVRLWEKDNPSIAQRAAITAAEMKRWGESVSNYERSTGPVAGFFDDLIRSAPMTLGGVGIGLGVGVAARNPGAGLTAGSVFMGLSDASMAMEETYERAIAKGTPEADAVRQANAVGAVYAPASVLLERVGLGAILGKGLTGAGKNRLLAAAKRVVVAGATEGTTELMQEATSEAIRGYVTEDFGEFKQLWTESDQPLRAFLSGAVMGGAVRTAGEVINPNNYRTAKAFIVDAEAAGAEAASEVTGEGAAVAGVGLDGTGAAVADVPQAQGVLGPEGRGGQQTDANDQAQPGTFSPLLQTDGQQQRQDGGAGQSGVAQQTAQPAADGRDGDPQQPQAQAPGDVVADGDFVRVQGAPPISPVAARRFNEANKVAGVRQVEPTTQPQRAAVSFFAERGVPVYLVESPDGSPLRVPAMWTSSGVVIDANAGTPEYTRALVYHEAFHDLKRRNPAAWKKAHDAVRELDPEGLAAAEAAYFADSKRSGVEQDQEALGEEEALSRYAEGMVAWLEAARRDPAKMRRLAEQNPRTMARVLDAIQRAMRSVGFNVTPIFERQNAQRTGASLALELTQALDTLIGQPMPSRPAPARTQAATVTEPSPATPSPEVSSPRPTNPAPIARESVELPAPRAVVRDRRASDFSNRAIQRRLQDLADGAGRTEQDAMDETVQDGDQYDLALDTSFAGPIPMEIRTALEGLPPNVRTRFKGNVRGGGGADVMAAIGADEMIARVQRQLEGREARVERLLESDNLDRVSADAGMLAAVRQARAGKRADSLVPFEVVDNPGALPEGATFEIEGRQWVKVGNEGVSADGRERFNLGGVESMPVDRGRLNRNAQATPAEVNILDDLPFAVRPSGPVARDLMGRPIFEPATGRQQELPLPRESEIERQDRERRERQARENGDDPDQMTMFAVAPAPGTPEFRRWFGDSKAVDEQGRPQVMYHGTSGAGFTVFDTFASNYGLMGQGGYFTADPALASSYTTKGRGQSQGVYPVFLSIKNPIDMDAQADPEAWKRAFPDAGVFHEGGTTNESWYRAAEGSIRDMRVPMYEGAEIMQDGLRAMGHDGVTHIGGGRVDRDGVRHRVFVAFEPEQIKSATGNRGTFDPNDPDIRFAVRPDPKAVSLLDALPDPPQPSRAQRKFFARNSTDGMFNGINPDPQTGFEAMLFSFRRTMQDKFLPILRVQQAVERAGGRVSDEANAYRTETLYYGRSAEASRQFNKRIVEPLFRKMTEAGVDRGELDLYLYAKHAPERNRVIRDKNPDFTGDGSGMSDADAAAIVSRFEGGDKGQAFKDLAAEVGKVREWSLNYMVENDLLSKAQAESWRATYENYVPLRTADPGNMPMRVGEGFQARGPESKEAKGRGSLADSPVLFLLHQADNAIVRAERNRVAVSLRQLVLDNPDRSLWNVYARNVKQTSEPDMWGNTETEIVRNPARPEFDQRNTIVAKVKGEDQYIVIENENLVRAMKNMGTAQVPGALRVLGALMRIRSSLVTTYSPEFLLTNFTRDIQTAAFNITAEINTETAKRVAGNVRKAMAGAWEATRAERRDSDAVDGEWAKMFREFVEDGGKTGWAGAYSFDQRARSVEQIARAVSGDRNRIIEVLAGVKNLVEDANIAVENAVRVALYAELRRQGVSRSHAAETGKNLTVNFNRRGEAGTLLNTLYLFYNAGVQGSVRTLQAANTRRGRKIVGGIVAAGVAMNILNAFLSDEDEDGELFYDKISPWIRSHNFIVMLPGTGGRYIKIPLPYGYNVFYAMGTHVATAARGEQSAGESAGHIGASFLNSFNPIGGGLGLADLTPEFAKPFVELGINRNFADAPINPERFPGDTRPDSEVYYQRSSIPAREAAAFFNRLTGGNEVEPGAVDISPGTIDHITSFITGAAGRFVKESVWDIPARIIGPEELAVQSTPFARRFLGTQSERRHESSFWRNKGEMDALVGFERRYLQSGDPSRAETFRARHGVELDAAREFQVYAKVVDDLRERLAEGDDRVTEEQIQGLLVESNRMVRAAKRGEAIETPLLDSVSGVGRIRREQRTRLRQTERDAARSGG